MTSSDIAAQAAIAVAARDLHLPTVRDEAVRLAQIATRERHSHLAYLAEVLCAEVDDRDQRRRARRVNEARFPRIKRLADFNLDLVPTIAPATLAHLASGAYLDAGDPVVMLGDSGTGKSHQLNPKDHLDLRTAREVRLPALTDAAGICRGAVERALGGPYTRSSAR